MKNETNKYFERYLDVVSENKKYKDNKGKSFYEFKAYVYMTEPAHIRTALSKLQNELDPGLDVKKDSIRGMEVSTSHPDFKKCLKCGTMEHETKDHVDLCLRLVLFQPLNWTYSEYIKKKIGAYKITTGFNNKGRIGNWGFAHFQTTEEREKAATGLKEMFHDHQILEKILMFDHGPPECCYLCGQVNHLAGNKRHKQDQCPLRKRPPPRSDEIETTDEKGERKKEQKNVRFNAWATVNQQNKQTSKPHVVEKESKYQPKNTSPLYCL